ncbi:hypothetical protein RhiirA4_546126 [Rhizophagus irregularis]|uniref:Uncharacterized protein n=1 Tax=Rhizophagus irregularis TaxID=588596 RepID=A0A2I1GW21_9GLOM|nr:hypothetical protein RhiirA4_546126 [Rhizophagus irregularis]
MANDDNSVKWESKYMVQRSGKISPWSIPINRSTAFQPPLEQNFEGFGFTAFGQNFKGAGESGKSTILKQMKLIHAAGFSSVEKETYTVERIRRLRLRYEEYEESDLILVWDVAKQSRKYSKLTPIIRAVFQGLPNLFHIQEQEIITANA